MQNFQRVMYVLTKDDTKTKHLEFMVLEINWDKDDLGAPIGSAELLVAKRQCAFNLERILKLAHTEFEIIDVRTSGLLCFNKEGT